MGNMGKTSILETQVRSDAVYLLPSQSSQIRGNFEDKILNRGWGTDLIFISARVGCSERIYPEWMRKLKFSGLSIWLSSRDFNCKDEFLTSMN